MTSTHTDQGSSSAKRPRSKFPQSFWVANTMEIFERLAWYGFFAVSSLYITGSVSEGALGFTSEQRGQLQGIVPFILYLLPVVFGALGDRFGYKKTFIVAYSVLVPAYYLLGQFTAFGTFFMAFLFVAVGAAIFKPVVVGTVARTTDETNSSMGFGIFYMMVNVGGFVGPVVAGIVRVRYGWDFVFIASAFWIACNFIWLFLFYKEPTTEAGSAQKRSLRQVFGGIVEVLGNGRFFIMVFGILLMLMLGGRNLTWTMIGLIAAGWVALNLIVDVFLRAREKRTGPVKGLAAPMRLGNWKFALYLLILSGFWTSFNQIFLTMPEFIRDHVETRDMVNTARSLLGDNFARGFAAVNENLLSEEIGRYVSEDAKNMPVHVAAVADGSYMNAFDKMTPNTVPAGMEARPLRLNEEQTKTIRRALFDFKVRVPEEVLVRSVAAIPLHSLPLDTTIGHALLGELRTGATGKSSSDIIAGFINRKVSELYPVSAASGEAQTPVRVVSERAVARIDSMSKAMPLNDRQMTYLLSGVTFAAPADLRAQAHAFAEGYRQVNPEYIINVDAGAIVVFQVLISYLIGFIPPLSAMVIGIVVAAVGIGMSAWLYSGWLVTLAITIFAFGEMMASPKSQEYVGRIAPRQKVAMYMGFYFWTVALGNIFGGRLSGELYGTLARDAGRPDIMWMIFGGLGLLTAVVLILYDRLVISGGKME